MGLDATAWRRRYEFRDHIEECRNLIGTLERAHLALSHLVPETTLDLGPAIARR